MEKGYSDETHGGSDSWLADANAILKREDFEKVRRPLELAVSPPGYYYTDEKLFRIEFEQIFLKEWLWVGHMGQINEIGDYFTFSYEEENVVVVRDNSGQVKAFSSVCRHRGALVAKGNGNCKFFKCPYHAWIYGLDGKLLSTPDMDGVQEFNKSNYGLVPINVDTWEGQIFINFDEKCAPLSETLGNLPEKVARFRLGEQVCTNRRVYDFDCNWKVTTENAMDEYHLAGTHATDKITEYEMMENWEHVQDPGGRYDSMIFTGSEPMTQSAAEDGGGTIAKPKYTIEGLSELDLRQHHFILLYPNVMITFMPDSSGVFVIVPDGPHKSKVIYDWYYPKEALADPGFEKTADGGYAGVTGFIQQDVDVLALTQKGYSSNRYQPGRYSMYEPLPYRNVQYILDRLQQP